MFLVLFFASCIFCHQFGVSNNVSSHGGLIQPLDQTFVDSIQWWAHQIASGMIRSRTSSQEQPSLDGIWPTFVDWANPPIYERSSSESACWRNWFTCSSVAFTWRTELVNDPIPPPFEAFLSHLPPELFDPKAKVFATKHRESVESNQLDQSVIMSIESSTRTFKYTDNWKIEANLDNQGNLYFKKGDPSRVKKSGIKNVVETFECPAKKTCTLETWTIHATLTGYCRRRPSVKCGGDETDICFPLSLERASNELYGPVRLHQWGDCEQFNQFVWNNCYRQAADKCFGPTAEACEISTPVLYNDEPLSIVIPRAISASSDSLSL
ncbi:hypothetical protein XA68_14176 [Ophiocordyceps unilateralis]|uniref:Uncharacterized protein n=1 Tax=Ophiocordyceps unilateralis TaxID=268505 RepID=A0A2A9PND2_OPHUN|nr:hypothetical protein XA68_14176 [Ophiocordyceps unilateralis]